MTPRQQRFRDEYLVDLNGTQAAIRAGYSAQTAEAAASRLLRNVKVSEGIKVAMKERERRTEITADYVLSTIRDTVERCRQAEPVLNRDGEPTGEYRFDAQAVLKGTELLGKHLKMWTDKVETTSDMRVQLQQLSDEELDQKLQSVMQELGYAVVKQ